MAVNASSLAFIDIQLSAGGSGAEDVKVHTGLGSPYPDTSRWADYIGAGALLSLSSVHDTAQTSASEYELRLDLPPELEKGRETGALFEDIRRRDLQATPICIHAVDITAARRSNPPEPALILLGRINRIDLSPGGIICHIYTPATLLNKVVGSVTRLNDLEHKRYVDGEDSALRFISEVGSDVYFP